MSKILFEVGAFDGKDSLNFHKQGYVVYTFEPKKDLYENLKNKTKHLKNYNVYNKAVYHENCTKKFNICKQGGASSILEFKSNEELIKHWTNKRTDIHYSGLSYDVECIRLDNFIENENLQNNFIDYLHIDAQGVDYEVLLSLGKYLKNVKKGVVETVKDNSKSIYKDQINNVDVLTKFLTENNFIVEKIVSNDPTNCEFNLHFRNLDF